MNWIGIGVVYRKSGSNVNRHAVEGFKTGKVKRHGCPSHGIALTPDETVLWINESVNTGCTSSTRR
jgi:hypothetical protein